jgi:FAD dependent oxidoreductase TIGR03364
MKRSSKYDVAIVGAGIVGLSIAYTAAQQNKRVVVFEKNPKAAGASIRNFGMLWPIGQPQGEHRNRALASREIWKKITSEAGIWMVENGSLHLAYHDDEMQVLEEFIQSESTNESLKLIAPKEVEQYNSIVKKEGLKGALWSDTEMLVDPREAIEKLPEFLQKKYKVEFQFGTAITQVDGNYLYSFDDQWIAEEVYVCSGSDFETLYPQVFKDTAITKSKLQMMRGELPHEKTHMGASLCAGLTLGHYASFAHCPTLKEVVARYDQENILYKKYGIHVLLSQNGKGEFSIGDSHEYGWEMMPFDKEEINELILNYLHSFTNLQNLKITERWNGVYPKLPGHNFLVEKPQPEVTIVNALGGAGMTLSFGLAAEVFTKNLVS